MIDESDEGPEFEVWNHLDSGWQMAHDDLANQLEPDTLRFVEVVAAIIVGAKATLHLDAEMAPIRERLREVGPSIDPSYDERLLSAFLALYENRSNSLLTHAVQLELARGGLDRATEAFDRFDTLVPQLSQRPLPKAAEPYLQEAIQTYLYGFDPACIALCRSALEHVCKDVLLRLGEYHSERHIRDEKPSLETLTEKLRQAGALSVAFDAAKRLRIKGNEVLHKHMYDARYRRQLALDSISDLTSVLREVLP